MRKSSLDGGRGMRKTANRPVPVRGRWSGIRRRDASGVLDSRCCRTGNSSPNGIGHRRADSKDRLLSQAIFEFHPSGEGEPFETSSAWIDRPARTPGTGKTSLARGLASRTAEAIGKLGQFRFIRGRTACAHWCGAWQEPTGRA